MWIGAIPYDDAAGRRSHTVVAVGALGAVRAVGSVGAGLASSGRAGAALTAVAAGTTDGVTGASRCSDAAGAAVAVLARPPRETVTDQQTTRTDQTQNRPTARPRHHGRGPQRGGRRAATGTADRR